MVPPLVVVLTFVPLVPLVWSHALNFNTSCLVTFVGGLSGLVTLDL